MATPPSQLAINYKSMGRKQDYKKRCFANLGFVMGILQTLSPLGKGLVKEKVAEIMTTSFLRSFVKVSFKLDQVSFSTSESQHHPHQHYYRQLFILEKLIEITDTDLDPQENN